MTAADFFAAFLTGTLTAFAGADFLGAAFWAATLAATFFAAFAGAVFTAVLLTGLSWRQPVPVSPLPPSLPPTTEGVD